MNAYESERNLMGDAAFYGDNGATSIGVHKDSKEAIDNMVEDLEKQ